MTIQRRGRGKLAKRRRIKALAETVDADLPDLGFQAKFRSPAGSGIHLDLIVV